MTVETPAARQPFAPFGDAAASGDLRRSPTVESASFPAPFDPPEAFTQTAAGDAFDEDPTALIVAGRRRRRNIVLGALAAAAVAIAAYAGYGAWKDRPFEVPMEAATAHDEALSALRRDDAASLAAAERSLSTVVQKWPDYSEARASHLTALLFQLDDVRMQIEQLNQRSTELNTQIARLKDRKVPSDWENRVNALVDRIGALKKESDPLVDRATALDGQVNETFRALQERMTGKLSAEQEQHLVRAQALYFGVKGSDQAVALAERFRGLGGAGGWGDVAYAEYALNARVAPQTRRQAREALAQLNAVDSTFIRLYVLIGRLALAEKDPARAASSFEAAATLNPDHAAAAQLLKTARALQAAAESDEVAAEGR